jgi:hypothetical protein
MEEMMRKRAWALVALTLTAACAGRDRTDTAVADSLGRDLELAPAESTATLNDQPAAEPEPQAETPRSNPPPRQNPRPSTPRPANPQPDPAVNNPAPQRPPVAAAPLTLPAGTAISASSNDSINSRTDKVGEAVTARISSDIKDQNGRVIIPAGSVAHFTIAALAPAENKNATRGTINLTLTSITVGGRDYPISGSSSSVEHTLHGRGVTTGDAAKVGAGAAAGAIAGRILGGKKGTVIGGVVGAAVGTGVAVETADRDVVVAPGATISFTLGEEITVYN